MYIWQWNFGDGTTATNQNPNHTYLSPGTYLVQLYAESTGGCGAFHTASLDVHQLPIASFIHSGNCEGQMVSFTNTSSAVSAPISSYLWDFDQQGTIS